MFLRTAMLLAVLPAVSAQATTITFSDLPASVQSCSTCIVNTTSTYDLTSVSVFQVINPSSQDWLIRYRLGTSSAQSFTWLYPFETHVNSYDQLSGYLWLSVQSQYSSTETSHPFTLYFDKITPLPNLIVNSNSNGTDLILTMPTTDLLAGSSFYYAEFTDYSHGYQNGSLGGQLPQMVATPPSYANAQLDLVGLTYNDFGSYIGFAGVNPADTRSVVYTQGSGFASPNPLDAFDALQTYDLSSVPLPGAIWLFGSSLIGLFGVMRRCGGPRR
jgi:hypothetical protein